MNKEVMLYFLWQVTSILTLIKDSELLRELAQSDSDLVTIATNALDVVTLLKVRVEQALTSVEE